MSRTRDLARLHVDSDGNVGVGYDAPGAHIHVLGSTSTPTAHMVLQSKDTAGADAKLDLYARDSSNVNQITSVRNHLGNTVIEGGSVGINHSSPDTQLHVRGTFTLDGGNGEAGPYIYRDNGNGPDVRFRTHNNTYDAPTLKTANQNCGQIHWGPYNGTDYVNRASIVAQIDDGVTTTSTYIPTHLTLWTGDYGNYKRVKINSTGQTHFYNGISGGAIKVVNLTNSFQNILGVDGALGAQGSGYCICATAENSYRQGWLLTYSNNAFHVHYFGGDEGHAHSKDVAFQVSGGYLQARRVNYTTGRPLSIFQVHGAFTKDFD